MEAILKKQFLIFLFALGVSSQSMNASNADGMFLQSHREIPIVSTVGPISVANFNLNRQGSSIVARGGERIFSTLNFSCESSHADPNSLYQIVVGYGEVGPQKCIFNELGYQFDGKEGILSFFCEAPKSPGVYEVQCNISSARSSAEALQSWWDQSGGDHDAKVTIGRIVVK
jgi:hypothetical protein